MKRLVSIAIVFLLLAGSISAAAYSSGSISNGDVNRDGILSIKDATCIQQQLALLRSFDEQQLRLADVNLDNAVNIKDATLIQKVIALLDTLPEEPETEPQPVTETTTGTAPGTAVETTTETATSQPEEATETTEPAQPETEPQNEINSEIKITYRNSLKWSKVYFYFYSSDGKSEVRSWPGVAPSKSGTYSGDDTYSYTIDISKFNRVVFNNGSDKSMDVPLGLSSTGFCLTGKKNSDGKYIVDKYRTSDMKKGTLKTTTLTYSTGYEKKIWIYTPAGYSADSKQKYPTVYVCDGQNLFSDHKDGYGGWNVDGAVDGLLANTGRGVIAVGIDNGNSKRDSELTPNIGKINPSLSASDQKNYSNGTERRTLTLSSTR